MIESIDPMVFFGVAGAVGGAARGVLAFYKIKKEKPKTEFDISVFGDTLVEGVITGVAASLGLPFNGVSLIVAGIASAGVDSYTNKLGIKILPMLKDMANKKGDSRKKKK
jgi:hypothetical protein